MQSMPAKGEVVQKETRHGCLQPCHCIPPAFYALETAELALTIHPIAGGMCLAMHERCQSKYECAQYL